MISVQQGATNSVIGGGNNNNIADGANFGAILGGADHNINGGTHNLIGGGLNNNITTGNYNAILGGQNNLVVSGNHSAVLGGINNSVTGDLSFALGTGNTAANNGFALGNGSTADANEYYAKYSAGFVMEGARNSKSELHRYLYQSHRRQWYCHPTCKSRSGRNKSFR
jgi:hypothetical protein